MIKGFKKILTLLQRIRGKSLRPFRVKLDWKAGEEHLPLLYLKYLIDEGKEDYGFKLELEPGTGSVESVKTVKEGECDIALCGAVTFAEHFTKINQDLLSLGIYIKKLPVVLIIDMEVIKGMKMQGTDYLEAGPELKDSDEVLGQLFNGWKIGVFPGSTVRDWFRCFAERHHLKPKAIVEFQDSREFATNMFHDVGFLVCYEYNQAVEVLNRDNAENRFCRILLRETEPNGRDRESNIRLMKGKCVQLKSVKEIEYSQMPGVAIIARCSKFRDKGFRERTTILFRELEKRLEEIKKISRQTNGIDKLTKLSVKISEDVDVYAYDDSRLVSKRLELLNEMYWGSSLSTSNGIKAWEHIVKMCKFPEHSVRQATDSEPGIFYNL